MRLPAPGWATSISGGTTVGTMFQFKKDAKGELVATFGIPDQGLTDSPVTNVEFDGTRLSMNIPPDPGPDIPGRWPPASSPAT